MAVNIFTGRMQHAQLFGRPVLTTNWLIPRETVPDNWFCYDMQGTDRDPAAHAGLVSRAVFHHSGTVLSPVPLMPPDAAVRRIGKRDYFLHGEEMDLEAFCEEYGLDFPDNPIKFEVRPASPDEAGIFYALPPEEDKKLGAVGHVRIDFGHEGKEFWHTWWPRGPEELNTPEFKGELGQVVNQLRRSVLKDLSSMRRWCCSHGGEIEGGICARNYGYVVETERYRYCLRCNPVEGDYQAYLTCFDKQAQQMGLSEGDKEPSHAAGPDEPHDYCWYVIEHLNRGEVRRDYQLPLEEAVRLYAGLDSAGKRLGVTKDGIDSVDLAVSLNGQEQLYDGWQRLDSFARDPVVAGAAELIRQTLEEQIMDAELYDLYGMEPEEDPGPSMGEMRL